VAAAAAAKPASDQAFTGGKKAFDAGNVESARNGFQKLIADYPSLRRRTTPSSGSVKPIIGKSGMRKPSLEYQKVIEKYPSGNKAPAALLKQGLSFLKIGETNNARLVLKELVAKHPSTNEASNRQTKIGIPLIRMTPDCRAPCFWHMLPGDAMVGHSRMR
jgi:TolA-binding protein